ncbi:hypothetical protein KO505_07425 [Psychrosphaera sp. F3M07]|jgi:hypothetical protein|uniref:hypothetical protein n=1 Tax=Psychrosphaera sp. F3M07 TaxID=2841560 RepID=UPI001C0A1A93|nr:hypothetical protein [Psychrosphaera sp. F3M07]MBU2917791.1 hypothetical protein [Psychrosphaera sp. F3M07]
MSEAAYITSGRNTIIHKIRKMDLLIVSEIEHPVIKVTQNGLMVHDGPVPRNRREAKDAYCEVIHIASPDIFGEPKTLLFVQCLNGKEYKVDYSKTDSPLFIRVHQQSYI